MIDRVLLLGLATLLAAGSAAGQDPDAEYLLARADSAFDAGDAAAARALYGDVLRLAPYQSRAVYQLGILEPPGSPEQIRRLRHYTELEPQDAWGFAALGDAHREAGSVDAARTAYRRALAIAPSAPDIRAGLAALGGVSRARSLSIEPLGHFAGDSDGNGMTESGAGATLRLGVGSVGVEAARLVVSDGIASVAGWTAELKGELRPVRALSLSGRAGLLSVRDRGSDAAVSEPVARARLRWRPERGIALELRARHGPVTATPLLLASPVVLSEARATLEIPLIAALHARVLGRHGRLRDPADVNTRTMIGAGPVLRLTPTLELNALAGRSGYAHASTAGYFAPERVDVLDAGFYWERDGARRLAIALDAGGGFERITPFGGARGDWAPALRLWGLATWSFSPAAALRLEVEAYDTRAGEGLAATGEGWRWGSVAAGLRIRP